jgi:hypothetical protein
MVTKEVEVQEVILEEITSVYLLADYKKILNMLLIFVKRLWLLIIERTFLIKILLKGGK